MTSNPALEEFARLIGLLRKHPRIAPHMRGEEIVFESFSPHDVAALIREEPAYYFLISAAGLNRTSLKKALGEPAVAIVEKGLRRAFVIRERLPARVAFTDVAVRAVALRRGDLERRSKGRIEALFRERLISEGIPLLMSPPIRHVPGVLIARRKPDGVFPDPATDAAPAVYLEIKNVRRVADDIQKRLYEIAEASIEMKVLYGSLKLEGLGFTKVTDLIKELPGTRSRIRARIIASRPTVVVLLLCSRTEAERYRAGAETFVDRVFFQEEIEECLRFLKEAVTVSR